MQHNKQSATPELPNLFRKMKLEQTFTDLDAEAGHITTPRRGSKTKSVVWTGATPGLLFGKNDEELGKDDDFGREDTDANEPAWPEGRPDDASDYWPSDPEDDATLKNLLLGPTTPQLLVCLAGTAVLPSTPVTRSKKELKLSKSNDMTGPTTWTNVPDACKQHLASLVEQGLPPVPGVESNHFAPNMRKAKFAARAWDTALRLKTSIAIPGGVVSLGEDIQGGPGYDRDIQQFICRAYRYNVENDRWTPKGPLTLMVVPHMQWVLATYLYGRRDEAFNFRVWETFMKTCHPHTQPGSNGGKSRHLVYFHTCGTSLWKTSINGPTQDENAYRILSDHVQVMPESSVTPDLCEDGEPWRGRRWCLEFASAEEIVHLMSSFNTCVEHVKMKESKRRLATFSGKKMSIAWEDGKVGDACSDETKHALHAILRQCEGYEWPWGRDGTDQLARQGLVHQPLVTKHEVLPDAVRCEFCGFALAGLDKWARGHKGWGEGGQGPFQMDEWHKNSRQSKKMFGGCCPIFT